MVPSLFFNIFFFWSERDTYKREKRNFDGWHEEMKYLLDPRDEKVRWVENLASISMKRRPYLKNKYNKYSNNHRLWSNTFISKSSDITNPQTV